MRRGGSLLIRLCRKLQFILLVAFAFPAEGAVFEVVKTISGCKYFVIEQGPNYIFAEDWLCFSPSIGDTGAGNLNSYGIKKVQLSGLVCDLYVEDYMLSKSRALEKLIEKCQ